MAGQKSFGWRIVAVVGATTATLTACGGPASPAPSPSAPAAAPATSESFPHPNVPTGYFDQDGTYHPGPDIPQELGGFVAVARREVPASSTPGWSDGDWVSTGKSVCQDLADGRKSVAEETRDMMGLHVTYDQAHLVVTSAREHWCWDPYRELREHTQGR